MDAQILIALLAIATLGGVVVFALLSKNRVEEKRKDENDSGSSLS